MVRKLAILLASGWTVGLVLVVAAQSPTRGDDTAPVIAGTFTVRYDVQKNTNPMILRVRSGTRTFSFGKGCSAGRACSFDGAVQGSAAPQPARLTGGALSFHSDSLVDCTNTATGAVSTRGGGREVTDGRLVPSATTVRHGVTFVTAMRGVITVRAEITAAGRADSCTIPPRSTLVETARSVVTATLAPLAAPRPITSSPPLGVTPAPAAARGTVPGFTLPQNDRARSSARAVTDGRRSSVPGALVTPSDAAGTILDRLPQDLLLVALLGLLMIFPAQIFNSTYEENHERVDRQLARLRPRRRVGATAAPSRRRRVTVFLACALVGTLLGGLLDPKFGTNTASYALVVGLFVALVLAVLGTAITGRLFRSVTHRSHEWYLRAVPSALLVAAAGVVVSRMTSFEPGYLYGVLGGAVFAAGLERRSEGRAEVAVTLVTLVVALVAWVGFEPVARAADGTHPAFWLLSLDAFLAALFIGGIEGLVFGLVPLRFLPGYRVKGWSWLAWTAITAVVLFTFVHVLLQPEAGYLGRSTAASVQLSMGLFAAFGVASGLFWLYFRLRPSSTADEEPGHEPEEGPSEGADDEVSAPGSPRPTVRVGVPSSATPDAPSVPRQSRPDRDGVS